MAKPKESIPALTPLNFKEGKLKSNSLDKSMDAGDSVDKYDPSVFCRTCANLDPCLVPIFKDEGLDYNLHRKIEKYLPIQVSEKDDLPVHICYHCASTLIAWDTLVEGCVEAEKKLTALKKSSKTKDSDEVEDGGELIIAEIDSDDEPLIAKKLAPERVEVGEKRDVLQEKNDFQDLLEPIDMESERLEDLLECEKNNPNEEEEENESICEGEKETSTKSQVKSEDWNIIPKSWLSIISCKHCGKISCAPKHLRQHERRATCTKTHQCPDCGQAFSKESNYAKHMKSHTEEKASGEQIKRFTCSVCNKKFKFEDNGLAHEKICGKGDATHKCSVCGKRFETKELADQHWTSHHRSCVCHMCGQSFSKPESLKQHVKTVHEEFKMVCHYCGKEFSRKARLQEHLQHHTGQMDFTCHVCGKGSTNAYSFSVHLATHTQETPYSCSFCPRTFKHMKYVYLHERSVHLKLKSGKTYVKRKKPGKNVAQRTCPLCNKMFKRESAMLIHKRSVHEGKNAYVCKLCGKDFKYTYLLYVHKKKHHFPELCKYICEFCEKPFPVKTELQNHLRKHTGEKPYVCGLCGKTYSFHGSLNMHMKTQHENKKNYKCDICGASYNFQSHLTRHMTAHADRYPVEILLKEDP